MKLVKVEFIIKLDKKIYLKNSQTREEFFKQYVWNHVASDYNFIANSVDRMAEPKDKDKYGNYVETLKHIKQSLIDSSVYEVLNEENNIEEVKIKCEFNYYENMISTLEKTVEVEIFNQNIKSSYFMAEDIARVVRLISNDKEEEIKIAVNTYKHIGNLLTEAKHNVLVNGNRVEYQTFEFEQD